MKTSPLAPKGGFPKLPLVDGVTFAAVAAGVRYQGRDDVMLAHLCAGTAIAGVFTRSATRAAPVLDCEAKLGGDTTQEAAFVVNSGNANAFTGGRGIEAVNAVTSGVSEVLNIPQDRIFTASTGVIGEPLKAERITSKLSELKAALAPDATERAAKAIMTTDTFPKGASAVVDGITITGFAKGSGMIAPDMATMLVYIFTDAKIAQPRLQAILSRLTDKTFNCITVDSDTSTSDTLLLAATGKGPEVKDEAAFEAALGKVMLDLAHQVVRDGEGATKFVEIALTGAKDDKDAHRAAMAIANSPLVKTAVAGEDPNWGRIVMAVGKSGAQADRDRLSISFGDILVAENGWVSPSYTEEAGAGYMKADELKISVDLGIGEGSATVWTCDLTHGYIEINADYRS
ncbi:bifunctional glutamate N-acetyltransferase/amino-acid acetyltransferase ArgJ [Falsihalocynthiibacter sp. SS001]|uniref:bifunctional glutamate N-acetyltransferase/amino-acid acetyltransferase ArgJ n=1 Tax=Falsihalocynthiibacter sp. SS001 TaxID=3349698 RepID=UPI0036D25641